MKHLSTSLCLFLALPAGCGGPGQPGDADALGGQRDGGGDLSGQPRGTNIDADIDTDIDADIDTDLGASDLATRPDAPADGPARELAPGPGPGGPIGCAEVAARYCQKQRECAPLFLELTWNDLETCTSRVTLSCEDDLRARDSGFTDQSLPACVRELDEVGCRDFFAYQIPSCFPSGARPDGDRCGSSRQCQSGHCAFQGECGYCAPRRAAGEPCSRPDICLPGLHCTGVCVAPRQQDQPCSTQEPCDIGLHCSEGICQPSQAEGQACVGGSCDYWKGLFCNPATARCQRYGRAAAGQPCGVVDGGYAICIPGSRCIDAEQTGTGSCMGTSADGQACGGGRSCMHPARCSAMSCRLPDSPRCS
jgi:hypothetical protein